MNCATLLVLVVLLAGCGDSSMPPQASTPKTLTVKATDYGADWPLSVSEAIIGCEAPTKVFIDIAGRRCALNGKALDAGMERCDDASKTGNAVAFGIFINKAMALCKA